MDIELFGMTVDGSDGAMATTTEGYENWMDYALCTLQESQHDVHDWN